ncbi:OmpA family protein [Nafulsella turpanensis]|uniref:OmpA family protein n=1 Tax=Nafulsella turpanensis TaxID=1265690 RepID=UPI000344B6F5|nr:OmpA family protein [Nafulsella turpanensis]
MNKISRVFVFVWLVFILQAKGQDSPTQATEREGFPKKELTAINSAYAEARPLISDNGNTLYFSRRHHEGNKRGKKDFQDVWVSYRDTLTDQWSEPQNVGSLINNRKSNAIASLSPDGEEGIFFNTYRKTRRTPLIRSRLKGSDWTKPKGLEIENFINISSYADYFLDYKQNVLFLAIEGDSVIGEQDLYISFPNSEGGWKEPVNLGGVINTSKADFAPFMGADGRSLFFCSYGHKGEGGSDIYMSVRLDDSWLNWSEPVNLGPAINTALEETYFSITSDFQYLYYTSYHPKEENRNILRVELPENFTAINGPVLVKLDSAAISKIMLSGNFRIDELGQRTNFQGLSFAGWPAEEKKEEVDVVNIAAALEDSIYKEITAGIEKEITPAGNPASLVAEGGLENVSTGFGKDISIGSDGESLSVAAAELKSYLEKSLPNLDLVMRIEGNLIEFKIAQNLMYEFNSVFVTTDYVPRLARIARIMQERPELRIKLVGYTDNIGSEEVNKRVAMKRVQNLMYFFKERGIDTGRIELISGGEDKPLKENEDAEGRAWNRRVETTIQYQE